MNIKNGYRAVVASVALAGLLAACGGGGSGGSGGGAGSTSSEGGSGTPEFSTLAAFAGNVAGAGNLNGSGSAARFNGPGSVAIDSAGNLYVADTDNFAIRKITPSGLVSTFAGTLGVNYFTPAGTTQVFQDPCGVATDVSGNVYVADCVADTISKVDTSGVVTAFAGTSGKPGSSDGQGSAALFRSPAALATDSAGNLYVADKGNDTIRKITPAGLVSTFAGSAGQSGSSDGVGSAARFDSPVGLAVDALGRVYVADAGNDTIRIISPTGSVTTLAGIAGVKGSADGANLSATFNIPNGVALDNAGDVYVADTGNSTLRVISTAGTVTTLAGTPGVKGTSDGQGAAAGFVTPAGLAVDSAGNIYVADVQDDAIRQVTPAGAVTTFAGDTQLAAEGSSDGPGSIALFNSPEGLAADGAGNIYVADSQNYTIRKITPDGTVTTLAGLAGVAGSANGKGSAARFGGFIPEGGNADGFFAGPSAIAADSAGNLYVADTGNQLIRKITPQGVVSTLAGSAGVAGSADGSGERALFSAPEGIATDASGNVYVADTANNTIRMITPAGVVTTLAGSGIKGSADGVASAASFNIPVGVATDSAGNVYVEDAGNNTIRMVTPGGTVTTIAGQAGTVGSSDGPALSATFDFSSIYGGVAGIATDSAGNIYVADCNNNSIRLLTPAGQVSTIAGIPENYGFLPGPLPGALTLPVGVAVHAGAIYATTNEGVAVIR